MKFYAVAGNPISHSKSPAIMNYVMGKLRFKGFYTRILAGDIGDIAQLTEDIPLAGLNITAPFKRDILQLAHSQDEMVRSMSVANTLIQDKNGLFAAHNTDVKGVRDAVAHLFKEELNPNDESRGFISAHKKVLILGSGGAVPPAIKALEIFDCEVFLSGRNMEKTRELAGKTGVKTILFSQLPQKIGKFDLIINTIPVHIPLFDLFSLTSAQHVLDAAYKNPPLKDKCGEEGAQYISGESWLINQAIHGFRYFSGKWAEKTWFAEALQQISEQDASSNPTIIALIGPMGAGKSTVGKLLAEKMNYKWVDTDDRIESDTNRSIGSIFQKKGEAYFRGLEKELLKSLILEDRTVISCGGGIVLDETNRRLLNKYCHTVFLSVKAGKSIKRIGKSDQRPLLTGPNPAQKAYELIRERMVHYLSAATVVVNANSDSPQKLAELIYEDFSQTFKM